MKLDHLKDSIIIQLGKNHGMAFEILNIYVYKYWYCSSYRCPRLSFKCTVMFKKKIKCYFLSQNLLLIML